MGTGKVLVLGSQIYYLLVVYFLAILVMPAHATTSANPDAAKAAAKKTAALQRAEADRVANEKKKLPKDSAAYKAKDAEEKWLRAQADLTEANAGINGKVGDAVTAGDNINQLLDNPQGMDAAAVNGNPSDAPAGPRPTTPGIADQPVAGPEPMPLPADAPALTETQLQNAIANSQGVPTSATGTASPGGNGCSGCGGGGGSGGGMLAAALAGGAIGAAIGAAAAAGGGGDDPPAQTPVANAQLAQLNTVAEPQLATGPITHCLNATYNLVDCGTPAVVHCYDASGAAVRCR